MDQLADPREELADLLRGRILRALHGAALRRGDRLPSARDLGVEFGIDHRIVLDAYRVLADEGLVELRQRGGIYVAGTGGPGQVPLPSDAWLSEVFAQGIAREVPLTDLHEWLHRAVYSPASGNRDPGFERSAGGNVSGAFGGLRAGREGDRDQ
jgi:GntR family transcriptional regulator